MTVEKLREVTAKIQLVLNEYKRLHQGNVSKEEWINFFTSEDFLIVYTKNDFTNKLLKVVGDHTQNTPPSDDFLDLLYVAYGLVDLNHDDIEDSELIYFYGIEAIIEIVIKYRKPRKLSTLDVSIYKSFENYRILIAIAKIDERWNLRVLKIYMEIIEGYNEKYIHDTIKEEPLNHSIITALPKHKKTLTLLVHYFRTYKLTKDAYYRCWKNMKLYDIKNTKYHEYYERIKEILLEKLPILETIGDYFYDELNLAFRNYNIEAKTRTIDEFTREKKAVDNLFNHYEFFDAIHDEFFIEEVLLSLWLDFDKYIQTDYFLEKLYIACQEDESVPKRDQIIERIQSVTQHNEIHEKLLADEQSPILKNTVQIYNRAFFRYYIHSAFNLAKTNSGDIDLWYMLNAYFPYSKKWTERFLESDFNRTTIDVVEGQIEVVYHRYYIEYFLNGKQIYDRVIHCSQFFKIDDDNLFWKLLPCSFASEEDGYTVFMEVKNRLEKLQALTSNSIVIIADCITRHVCRKFDKVYQNFEITSYSEDKNSLYICSANMLTGEVNTIKKTVTSTPTVLESTVINGLDKQQAITMTKRNVDDYANNDYLINHKKITLPNHVYVRSLEKGDKEYNEGDITNKVLDELFKLYIQDEVIRLEFHYKNSDIDRSLVLTNDLAYACLVYDHKTCSRYGLLSSPELYYNKQKNDNFMEPMFYGKIQRYINHKHSDNITNNITDIICDTSSISIDPLENQNRWYKREFGGEKYYYDMATIGNFSFDRMKHNWNSPLYVPITPYSYSGKRIDNQPMTISTPENAIEEYLSGNLKKLVLKWKVSELDPIINQELISYEAFIILLKDKDEYMMIIGSDYLKKLYYLRNRGKAPGYTNFFDSKQYSTVIHEDTIQIRNYLSLLLLHMDAPFVFLRLFELYDFGDRKDVFEDALCLAGVNDYNDCKNSYYNI